ncbi:hypothetical protein ACSSS7_001938 [Eimeria intestinalis]
MESKSRQLSRPLEDWRAAFYHGRPEGTKYQGERRSQSRSSQMYSVCSFHGAHAVVFFPSGSRARKRSIRSERPSLLRGFAVAALLLLAVTPARCEYAFDEAEIASTANVELPLPRPFDATACGLQHLAQQQMLLRALQPLHSSATHHLLQDEALKVLFEARQANIFIDEARQATHLPQLDARNINTLANKIESAFYGDGQSFVGGARACGAPENIRVEVERLAGGKAAARKHREAPCVGQRRPGFIRIHMPLPTSEGRPYRPLPQAVDLESIQSVAFATTSNWPAPYWTLRSSLALRLPPQTTLGEEGERRMQQRSFRKRSGQIWVWESREHLEPLASAQPFGVVFPLPLDLGYIVTMERLLVAPLQGAVVYEDLYRIHNDAAAQKGAFSPTTLAQLQSLPPGVPRLAGRKSSVPQGKPVPSHVLFDVHAALPPDVFDLDVGDLAGNLTSTFAAREGPLDQPLSTHLEVSEANSASTTNTTALQLSTRAASCNPDNLRGDLALHSTHNCLPAVLRGASGATNIRYSAPFAFDLVEQTNLRWWFDMLFSRPALHLRWHAVSSPPAHVAKRELVVTYDYFYPVDLEWINLVFLVAIFAAAILAVTAVWHSNLRSEKLRALLSARESARATTTEALRAQQAFTEALSSYCEAVEAVAHAVRSGVEGSELEQAQRQLQLAAQDLHECSDLHTGSSMKEHRA